MGWWGMKPWDGDQHGDWWYDVGRAASAEAAKMIKQGFADAKPHRGRRGGADYSSLYAACGIVLRLAQAEIPVDAILWDHAMNGINEVAEHVDEMGWNDPVAAKREVLAIQRAMRRIDLKT